MMKRRLWIQKWAMDRELPLYGTNREHKNLIKAGPVSRWSGQSSKDVVWDMRLLTNVYKSNWLVWSIVVFQYWTHIFAIIHSISVYCFKKTNYAKIYTCTYKYAGQQLFVLEKDSSQHSSWILGNHCLGAEKTMRKSDPSSYQGRKTNSSKSIT